MLVDVPRASEHFGDVIEAELQAEREQPDRAGNAVPAANPVPEPKHALFRDSELASFGEVGRNCGQMCGERSLLILDAELLVRVQDPLPAHSRVHHGFRSRKGLGVDHEDGLLDIQPLERTQRVHGVDVREESELAALGVQVTLVVGPQGLVDELDAEIAASDAYDNGVEERLLGVAKGLGSSDGVRELFDPVLYSVDVGDDILAIDNDLRVGSSPERSVKHSSSLGGVEFFLGDERGLLLLGWI